MEEGHVFSRDLPQLKNHYWGPKKYFGLVRHYFLILFRSGTCFFARFATTQNSLHRMSLTTDNWGFWNIYFPNWFPFSIRRHSLGSLAYVGTWIPSQKSSPQYQNFWLGPYNFCISTLKQNYFLMLIMELLSYAGNARLKWSYHFELRNLKIQRMEMA